MTDIWVVDPNLDQIVRAMATPISPIVAENAGDRREPWPARNLLAKASVPSWVPPP